MAKSTDGGAPPGAPPHSFQPTPRPRPPGALPTRPIDVAPPPPETSSRSVQGVMLGLGALLLGVAAIAFVSVLSELDLWGRLVILLGVALLALAIPVPLTVRGLTATAEAIAVVGLVLIGVAAYALWTTGTVTVLSVPTYAGLTAAVIAGVGYGYYRLTQLPVPRFAGLVLLQSVAPLLAYGVVTRPSDWALVATLVATQNAVLGHLDLRLDLPPARYHLRYLAWALHAAALLVAAALAVVALVQGQTVDATVRAAVTLLLVAAVGQVGALTLRRAPLPEVAAGALTLALIGGAGRILAVALPGRVLLPVTAVVAVTGAALVLLPTRLRRGPAVALAVAAGVLGMVVAALALRAGLATVTAVLPPWQADLNGYQAHLAEAVSGTGWQLPTAAAALAIAGATTVPGPARRDAVVITGTLTLLAAPAGYGLGPMLTPWLLVVAAAAIAVTALDAPTHRAATVHLAAGGGLAVVAAGASLATPMLTATILAALTVAALVTAWGQPPPQVARRVTAWAGGAALLTFPATVTTGAATLDWGASEVLSAGAAAVCVCVGYAALRRLRDGEVPAPILGGAGLAATLLAATALAISEAALADRAVAGLLVVGALLVVAAPRIEILRPATWRYDGGDLAGAVVTAGVVATLARITSLVLPIEGAQGGLVVGAGLILVVALGIRALPGRSRRGPVLGLTGFAVVVAGVAGAAAVVSAARTITTQWSGDLSAWPPQPTWSGVSWAAPFALATLAVAARLVLPRPIRYDVTAGLVVLATIGAPPAFGTPWWSPTVLSLAVGAAYAFSTTVPRRAGGDPRAAQLRATAAALLGLYALATAVGQRWLLAVALGLIAVTAVAVAGLIVTQPAPTSQRRVGGAAVTVALLAAPAGLVTLASHLGHPPRDLITVSLAGSSLGLAALAVARDRIHSYLPYGTVGVAAGATAAALLAFATPHPPGVYAAAAALLGVLAELVRATAEPPAEAPTGVQTTSRISPPAGALIAAAVPTVVALIGVAPALSAALVAPYRVLGAPWQGPPTELATGPSVGAPSVLATLLLTLAAALAAVGFGGAVSRQTAPVIAPGLAVTILIAPAALGASWPSGTVAALAVFVIAALGVALTPPPPAGYQAQPLRVTRRLVLAIAVAAGGAGLAGSLADPWLTWAALAVMVGLGAVTAIAGRTESGRVVGWWFAMLSAHLFALDTALLVGAAPPQAGFFALAVAAVALAALPRLPRFRRAAAANERWVVEWAGGYLGLVIALTLGSRSLADLAAVLIAAGAVVGVAALRPGRSHLSRRVLLWAAAGSEIVAWWIIMALTEVALIEAYSLPFALFALAVGWLETRHRPGHSSWVVYGPALIAALAPSLLAVVVAGGPQPARQAWVLLGGVAAILLGSRGGQRAPLIVGAVVTAFGALHLLSLAGPWLMLIPIGLILLILGANNERRQRDLERLRGALSRMR